MIFREIKRAWMRQIRLCAGQSCTLTFGRIQFGGIAMRGTLLIVLALFGFIYSSGCVADLAGTTNTKPSTLKIGKADGGTVSVVPLDVGEKMFGKIMCFGTCDISIIRPDGTPAPIWYKWGDQFLLDETTPLEHYSASEEDIYFELVEDAWIVLILEDAPPENGGPPMILVSHQQAFQFTNNFGEPTCFLDIWDMDVGARHEYFVLFMPYGTCS